MTKLHLDLQKIGLTPNQSTIYLALVRMGEAKAGELIKKTGFHRNLVYGALQELQDKKLVSTSKQRGVQKYRTLSPSRLLVDLEEKERVAKGVVEELSLIAQKSTLQEITVYEGVEEFRRHAREMSLSVEFGDTIRYLGISPEWHTIVGHELEEELIKTQVQKRVKMKALAKSLSKEDLAYIKKTKPLAAVKINPLVATDTNAIEILKDRVAIKSYIEPYFVVDIRQPELAQNYKNYFDFLWKQKVSKLVK